MVGITEEVVKGVDAVVDLNLDEFEKMALRLGGNDSKYDSPNPYHEVLPVEDPEASNDSPDCPAQGTLGNEGSDVEGVMVGPGRDRNADGTGQTAGILG